ncbi:MAG: hypothetical protein AMXMBFR64_54270 [Myxococcales bacterium]
MIWEPMVLAHVGHTVHRVKIRDASTGVVSGAAFREDGLLLPDGGAALLAAELSAQRLAYGLLEPKLVEVLAETDEVTPVPVLLWFALESESGDKEALLSSLDVMLTAQTKHEEALAALRHRVEGKWADLSAVPLHWLERAPAARAWLTAADLWLAHELSDLGAVIYHPDPEPQGTSYQSTVHGLITGLDGEAERICVLEGRQPSAGHSLVIAGNYCEMGLADEHGRVVAGVIRSGATAGGGLASASETWYASWSDTGNPGPCDSQIAKQWCNATAQAHIWNWSFFSGTGDALLFDYYAKLPPNYPFIAMISGNITNYSRQDCGLGCAVPRQQVLTEPFNTLVVGGSNDCENSDRTDDEIWCWARDLNVSTRELPHLVAPAQDIDADGLQDYRGTSFAAPQVAAAAAQLMQQNGELRRWPEVVRSILMAGATESVSGPPLNLHDAIDDRDGAGELSILHSLFVGAPSSYRTVGGSPSPLGHHYRTLRATDFPANSSLGPFRARTSASNKRLRVVLSWDATVRCTDPLRPTQTCTAATLDADLDLQVFDGTPDPVAVSLTYDNSYEFVEFPIEADRTYDIMVSPFSWAASSTYIGLAWYITDFSTN